MKKSSIQYNDIAFLLHLNESRLVALKSLNLILASSEVKENLLERHLSDSKITD